MRINWNKLGFSDRQSSPETCGNKRSGVVFNCDDIDDNKREDEDLENNTMEYPTTVHNNLENIHETNNLSK